MSLKDLHQYDDIINLSPPVFAKHPRMPELDRAAQFSPFAALSGYEKALEETKTSAVYKVEHELEAEAVPEWE